MKRSTLNVQRSTFNRRPLHVEDWLHEPTASELKEQNAKLRAWLAGVAVAMVMGWGFFGLLLWLRTH